MKLLARLRDKRSWVRCMTSGAFEISSASQRMNPLVATWGQELPPGPQEATHNSRRGVLVTRKSHRKPPKRTPNRCDEPCADLMCPLRQVITFLNPDVRMDVVFFLLLTAAASASASTATKPTPTATTTQDYGLLLLLLLL